MRKLLASLGFFLACTLGAQATWINFNGMKCSYNLCLGSTTECELITSSGYGSWGYAHCAFDPQPTGTLTLPETLDGKKLVRIGRYAFYYCSGLTSVALPSTVREIDSDAFSGCSRLGELPKVPNVTDIGSQAFMYCTSLTNAVLPEGLVNLGYGAFAYCKNLHSVTLPATLKYEDGDQFRGCASDFRLMDSSWEHWMSIGVLSSGSSRSLLSAPADITLVLNGKEVTDLSDMPSSIRSIRRSAFCGYGRFKIDRLPSQVTNVGDYAFANCKKIVSFDFSRQDVTFGSGVFYKSGLDNVVLPDWMTSVPKYFLYGCNRLTNLTWPKNVEYIGQGAFADCTAIKDVRLPSTLTSIGPYAFNACTSLTNVTVPASVSSCNISAFLNCTRLKNVTFLGAQPTASNLYAGTPTNLLTTVIGYDVSWSNALAVGTWNDRPIVCIDDWPVRFDLGAMGVRTGGGELTQTVRTYGAATAPTVASTDEDYALSGWSRSLSDIRFFTTITAVYAPKPIAVKGASAVSMMRFDDGASIQLTALGGVKPYTWSAVSGFPAGLSISSSGVISGNTAALGASTVKVRVTDARNVSATLTYTLTVTENTNAKPVVDAVNPASSPALGPGATNTLAVTAHDPEGKALAYRWFVDGVEATGATGASFDFVEPKDGVLAHTVRCVIEDPVWKLGYTTETNWTVRTLSEPVISPAGAFFEKGTGTVSIICNIPEAEIFYALDFSPRLTDRFRYTGPFTVGTSCTVRAIARYKTYLTDYVSASFACATPAFSGPVGAGPKVLFTTGGAADWAPDGDSLRSGAIGPEEESWLKATFTGKGTFSFRWRTDCEHDIDETCSWDALEVYVDGRAERFAAIDDTCDWTAVEIPIAEKGDHTILWRFVRDDYDEPDATFQNCGWISSVSWNGELLPELALTATAAEVADALVDAADARLRAHVTTAVRYARFRTWALGVDAADEGANVLAHSRAWASFALAQPTLLESDLTDADLTVKTFAAASGGSGSFELTASVGTLAVGATADPDDLAEFIGVVGSSQLDTASFSSANVSSSFSASDDGELHLLVRPKTASDSFFFTLRCLP